MTAQARKVRQDEQQKLLDEIRSEVTEQEQDIGKSDLYRILGDLLRQQTDLGEPVISRDTFPEIPWEIKERVFRVFHEASNKVKEFRRSNDEGRRLYVRLRHWTSRQ